MYLYPSGAKYAGEWRDGVKDGRGVYTFPKASLGAEEGGPLGMGLCIAQVQHSVQAGGVLSSRAELPICCAAVQLLTGWASAAAVAMCCAGGQVLWLHDRAGWQALGVM